MVKVLKCTLFRWGFLLFRSIKAYRSAQLHQAIYSFRFDPVVQWHGGVVCLHHLNHIVGDQVFCAVAQDELCRSDDIFAAVQFNTV